MQNCFETLIFWLNYYINQKNQLDLSSRSPLNSPQGEYILLSLFHFVFNLLEREAFPEKVQRSWAIRILCERDRQENFICRNGIDII